MAKIHVYLNDQLLEQLRALDSDAEPVNMSALVRRAVAGEIQRRRAQDPAQGLAPASSIVA